MRIWSIWRSIRRIKVIGDRVEKRITIGRYIKRFKEKAGFFYRFCRRGIMVEIIKVYSLKIFFVFFVMIEFISCFSEIIFVKFTPKVVS